MLIQHKIISKHIIITKLCVCNLKEIKIKNAIKICRKIGAGSYMFTAVKARHL